MARMPRADAFLLDAARLTDDDKIIVLTAEQFGVFSRLFLRSWHQPERPGRIPDSEAVLASLAVCSLEDWRRIGPSIRHLFDTTSSPGFWLSPGIAETHRKQTKFIESQRVKGVISGQARRKARNRGSTAASTEVEPNANQPPNPRGSRFSVRENREPESKDAAPAARISEPLREESQTPQAAVPFSLVNGLSKSKGITAPKPKDPQRLDTASIAEIVNGRLDDARLHILFACLGKLWKEGMQHQRMAEEIARVYVDRHLSIANAWAYFNPRGKGFADIRASIGSKLSEQEGEKLKAAERAWLNEQARLEAYS